MYANAYLFPETVNGSVDNFFKVLVVQERLRWLTIEQFCFTLLATIAYIFMRSN